MTSSRKYKGKYVNIDPNNPDAVGICRLSNFVFNHKDLVKQMKWAGNTKVWTGLMVGKPFQDTLNEQNRPPMIKPDPLPIDNPSPPLKPPNALPYEELEQTLNDYKWGR